MVITTRRAQLSDIDWILAQLKTFANFYGSQISLYSKDIDWSKGQLKHFIENHYFLIAEAAEHETRIGFISGVLTPHIFNPSLTVLSETFWWVDEQYRGTRAGLMLLNEFTEWGKVNANWVTFAIEEHSPVDERCLTKRGFKLKEKNYIMENI